MSIGTNKRIKFKTLLICADILSVLLFMFVYVALSVNKLDEFDRNSKEEQLNIYHENVCDNLYSCLSEADFLYSYILKEKLTEYVSANLNLIDQNLAEQQVEKTNNSLKEISLSDTVINDFIIFAKNHNQKNLYSNLKEKEIENQNFPSFDIIQKSGVDKVLHTNLGCIVFCHKALFEDINYSKLTKLESGYIKNLIEYLSDSYIICNYINDKLFVSRFNVDYIKEKFSISEDKMVAVYNSSGKVVLGFNFQNENAEEFYKNIDLTKKFSQDNQNSYAVSTGFYGKLTAVTIDRNYKSGEGAQKVFLYLLAILISVLVSVLCVIIFSGGIFKKLNFLNSAIIRQKNADNLHLIKTDFNSKTKLNFSFSQRIFLTFLSSCFAALFVMSLALNINLGSQTRGVTREYSKQSLKNYQNEWETHYHKYNSISVNKFEKLLSEYSAYLDSDDLISKLEQELYYDFARIENHEGAYIVNNSNEVIYQTVFSSENYSLNNNLSQVLLKLEDVQISENDGVFIHSFEPSTNKKILAFAKRIYKNKKQLGTLVIFVDSSKIAIQSASDIFPSDFVVLNDENEIIVGESEDFNPAFLKNTQSFDTDKRIYYSLGRENKWLGKCVVLTKDKFYLNQLNEVRYYLIINAFLIGIVCVVFTAVFGKFLSRPLKLILDNINETPNMGYHSISSNFNTDELNSIAIAYNQMIKRIETLAEEGISKEIERSHLEVLQAQTEFKMLQQQINPHFLFNTLESINMLALKNNQTDTSKIVISLSNILRYGLSRETTVKVSREINVLKSYVDIQKYRFGDDFNVLYDLDELLFEVSIIKFVLQPIFENAISHGRLHTVENGTIKLTLRNYEDGVEFRISDNGVGMSEEKLNELREQLISDTESDSKDGGIGLKNVYRRIKLYYKGKGSMEVNSTEGKGTEVVLRLPFI